MDIDSLATSCAEMDDDAFIKKAYLTLLGRSADASGLKNYLVHLNGGMPRGQILKELANSPEAQRFGMRQPGKAVMPSPRPSPSTSSSVKPTLAVASLAELLLLSNSDFVHQAYRCVLGRQADRVGAEAFLKKLEAGKSKSSVIAEMSGSPEGQTFVSKLPGLDQWLKLTQQQGSVDDLMALQGDLFVIGAYIVLFKREPDPEGLARYAGLLKSGCSKSFILAALNDSQEAREKSANLPGLAGMLALYKKGQRRSWSGWYCRQVLGAESDLPADQERRALAHRLFERSVK